MNANNATVKKHSVLIVDDETFNLIAITHILEADYNILAVKSGLAAVNAAKEHNPDVILLDLVMPDMDGYAVITELKKSEQTRNIPVIFISGLDNPEDKEKGLHLGAADYLVKPFSPDLLKSRLLKQIELIAPTKNLP
ncbi:MAG: response regulator [Oscillospiraceae bacterium]|nr:response regulator [Oscillospiraceae bacterium]